MFRSWRLRQERVRLELANAILVSGRFECSSDFWYSLYPAEVHLATAFKKGAVSLVPTTDSSKISATKPAGDNSVHVVFKGQDFYLSEPPKPKTADVSQWQSNLVLWPYWWVNTTSIQANANMVESTMKACKYVQVLSTMLMTWDCLYDLYKLFENINCLRM